MWWSGLNFSLSFAHRGCDFAVTAQGGANAAGPRRAGGGA